MKSPISGGSLKELLAAAAGPSAAFVAAAMHLGWMHIVLYLILAVIARIAFGAADGISQGLKLGLSQRVRKAVQTPSERSRQEAKPPSSKAVPSVRHNSKAGPGLEARHQRTGEPRRPRSTAAAKNPSDED
jgi:hypothetical protein